MGDRFLLVLPEALGTLECTSFLRDNRHKLPAVLQYF